MYNKSFKLLLKKKNSIQKGGQKWNQLLLKRITQTMDPLVFCFWIVAWLWGRELDKAQKRLPSGKGRDEVHGFGQSQSVFPLSGLLFPYSLLLPSPSFLLPPFLPAPQQQCHSGRTSEQLQVCVLLADLPGWLLHTSHSHCICPSQGPSVSDLIWLKKNLCFLLMQQIMIKNSLITVASLNPIFFLIPYPILYGNLNKIVFGNV